VEILKFHFGERTPEIALAYGQDLIEQARKVGDVYRETDISYIMGEGFAFNNQFEQAIEWFTKADQLYKQQEDRLEDWIQNRATLIQTLLIIGKVEEGFVLLNEFHQIVEQKNDFKGKIKSYFLLGMAYDRVPNYDSALYYQKLIIQTEAAEDKNYYTKLACNAIGATYYQIGNYDSALTYFQKTFQIVEAEGDLNKELIALQNIAISYFALGNTNKAVEQHLRAADIAMQLDNKTALYRTYNNIAALFLETKDYEKALHYLHKAIAAPPQQAFSQYVNLGEVYEEGFHNLDSALFYFNKAKEVAEARENQFQLVEVKISLGDLLYKRKQLTLAKQYWEEVVETANKLNMNSKKILALKGLGQYYLDQDEAKKGLDYFLQAKNTLLNGAGNIYESVAIYKGLQEAYAKLGNYKEAYAHLQKMHAEQDTIFNQEKVKAVEDIHTKYETAKKDLENTRLADENKIQNLKISQQRTFNTLLIIGLSIFLLAVIGISYAFIKLKKTKKVVDEQYQELTKLYVEVNETKEQLTESNETKDRFFSMIGHDMKAPLQNLTILLDFLKKNLGSISDKAMISYLTSLKNEFGQILDVHNNLLFWALQQQNGISYTPVELNAVEIIQENINLLKSVSEAKMIDIELDLPESQLLYNDQNMFSFVIRNMISNAIKYNRPNGKITIQSDEKVNEVVFSIQDTGIGMDADTLQKLEDDQYAQLASKRRQKGTGLGLSVSRDFISKMGGEMHIESQMDVGTTIFLKFPIKPFEMSTSSTQLVENKN